LTKEEKEARDAERKKREEEAANTLHMGHGEQKKTFSFKKAESTEGTSKPIEKSAQQLKE
jgi:hypothetical protein